MTPVEPLGICKQFGSRCREWPRCPCGMNGVDPRPVKPATAPEGKGPSDHTNTARVKAQGENA